MLEFIADLVRNEHFRSRAEIATFVAALYPLYFSYRLTLYFRGHREKLAKMFNFEFLTDLLNFGLTLLMGVFLFTNWSDGVWGLVFIRPIIIVLNGVALHRLYNHYTRL